MSVAPASTTSTRAFDWNAQYGDNLEALMMAVQFEFVDLLDAQIASKMKKIDERNSQLKDGNDALNWLRGRQEGGIKGKDLNGSTNADDIAAAAWLEQAGVPGFHVNRDANGTPVSVRIDMKNKKDFRDWNKDEVNLAISTAQTSIDSLTSTAQIDMIQLQNLISKRGQAFEWTSGTYAKTDKTRDAITANTGR